MTGLTEAVRVIPRSWQNYRALVRARGSHPPDVFVPIDFPDFNFFPGALHKRGVPVVLHQPAVWPGGGRLKTMKSVADRVLVIFRSRRRSTRRKAFRSAFVGHPLPS